ncbi:hypothetical protein BH18GEM1_BH18GEM1_16680 [soil metagenome]
MIRYVGGRGLALALALSAGLATGTVGPGAAQESEGAGPAGYERLISDLPGGRTLVFHFVAHDSAAAAALAQATAWFRPAPVAAAGLPPESFHVIVAPSESAFRALTGGRAPDWGLAVAFPRLRRVVLRSPRLTGQSGADPATVLRHELGHLYLDVAAGKSGGGALPRWFNEGFAAFYADEWRWVSPIRLAWGRLTGSLTPLSQLAEGFPHAAPELAYIQSMAAVRGLRERGGDAGIALLLDRVRAGASFDAALRATYGLTLGQFYAGWESHLGREYGWGVAATDERALWVLLAALVAGAYFFRRRRVAREIERRRRREDAALGTPEDHSPGVEEWERYWEDGDDAWRGDDRDATL